MPLSPAMRHRLDRLLLIVAGLIVFAAIIGITVALGKEPTGTAIARIGLVTLFLVSVLPGIRTRYAALRARLAARQLRTTAPAIATTGLRRMDFYIAVAALVLVAGMFASGRRYSVTHYTLGSETLVYQRTDTWTGQAELWVMGTTTPQPKPSWVRFSGERHAAR